jgi:hypothetical protein
LVQWCCSIVASYYARRGGRSGNGAVCGSFFIVALSTASNIDWDAGAALSSLLHIILFVAMLLMLVPVVVNSMFLHIIVLVSILGALVLL